MNKVVFVESFGIPLYEERLVEKPTGEMKKGLFGGLKEVKEEIKEKVKIGESSSKVDGKRLSKDIEEVINKLNTEGYEVVTITPITSGNYDFNTHSIGDGGAGYGYGFSYTEGVIIVAKTNK